MSRAFCLGKKKKQTEETKNQNFLLRKVSFFFCGYDPKEAEARLHPMNLLSCLTLTNVGSVCTDVSTWPCREARTEATSPLTPIYCTATLLHTPVVSPQRSQICPISSCFFFCFFGVSLAAKLFHSPFTFSPLSAQRLNCSTPRKTRSCFRGSQWTCNHQNKKP